VQSGYIARRDYANNPSRFQLDIVPRKGEEALLRRGDLLIPCKVVLALQAESEHGLYNIEFYDPDDKHNLCRMTLVDKDRRLLEKKGGKIPINVTTMDDGAEVYKSVFQNYSDIARTEEMVNIHEAHRRRLEFCSLLGTTSGGKSHPNMQEHHVFFERQRRKLEAGVRCKGHFQCFYKGRLVTVHDPVIHRNEFHRTLDHPEVMKQGIMGLKNIHSMGPFLQGFEAMSSGRRTVYSYLLNMDTEAISEEHSTQMFSKAEELRGEPAWTKYSKATGAKFCTVAERGSDVHGLTPDPSQNTWSRIEMGRMHFLGTVDDSFRDLILSLAPKAALRALHVAPSALRQGPGTKPLRSYIKIPNQGDTRPEFHKAGEKLHQKKKWRESLMFFDLYTLFDGVDTPEAADARKFLKTWNLYLQLIAPTVNGFGLDTLKQANMAARSLTAQFEMLCFNYVPRFFKNLGVSYIKLLLVPDFIWRFGWTDELSIDTRMKAFWGKVGVAGGAGGNAEEWAITGFLRSLALLEVRLRIRLNKSSSLHIASLCGGFQFHSPISSSEKSTYLGILKAMFAGNIGVYLAQAFSRTRFDHSVRSQVRSLSLDKLQFFNTLRLTGQDPKKCYHPYHYDAAASNFSARGNLTRLPRVGSVAFVTGIDDAPRLIRIMVSIHQFNVKLLTHFLCRLYSALRFTSLEGMVMVGRLSWFNWSLPMSLPQYMMPLPLDISSIITLRPKE
jgi:hypothetical protein